MITRRCFNALAAASALASGIVAKRANALAWPTHPVRIVVPFAAGGPTDVIARIVAERLSKSWDQQVLIENRPGGGTNIANELVARSEPDGHTVLMGGSSQAATRGLYPSLSYDPIGDFAPVAFICSYSFFMFVPNSLPVKSVSEFIAYAKANPGKVNMASSGVGTSLHLSGELFKLMTGINMQHVPYRGSAPMLTDLLAGQVQIAFDNLQPSMPHINAGKLRALAVTTATRSHALPDLPTVADFVPGYEASTWNGVCAPKNTPVEIVDRLNREINAGLADPKINARLAEVGASAFSGSPADYGKLFAMKPRSGPR